LYSAKKEGSNKLQGRREADKTTTSKGLLLLLICHCHRHRHRDQEDDRSQR
jgi:hypothetical protein